VREKEAFSKIHQFKILIWSMAMIGQHA